jgi:tetratricopeptide (TPR) repeat protein
LALLLAGPVTAATTTAAWEDGQLAFEAGEYGRALELFETVKASGVSGPAVHYNIAVTQYKLRRYRDARKSFEFIDRQYPKMQLLAQYNLGLVAMKESRNRDARRHFQNAYRLSELGLPLGVTADSPLLELSGTLRGPMTGRNGFRLDGGAYLVRYLDFEEFNQSVLRIGGHYEWRSSDWLGQVGAHAGYSTLNGTGFENTNRLDFTVGRYLTSASSISIRYGYADVSAVEAIFSGIDGSRQRLELRYRWYRDDRSFSLAYRNESNDRNDPGVSPSRNRITLGFRYMPATGWGYEIGADFRVSKYDALVPAREEDLTALRLGVSRVVLTDWHAFAQLDVAKNDSNAVDFSYDRNQLTVGLLKFF